MAFLAQKLIYTINIWFNFVFGSFFEQDHPLNLFISGVYAKRWPKWARISIQKLMYLQSDQWLVFLTLTVRVPFHRKVFKWNKIWGYGVNFQKNERVEAATGSYSVTGDSFQYIYSVPVTKNHRNIRPRWIFMFLKVHEFSLTDIF